MDFVVSGHYCYCFPVIINRHHQLTGLLDNQNDTLRGYLQCNVTERMSSVRQLKRLMRSVSLALLASHRKFQSHTASQTPCRLRTNRMV